MSTMRSACIKVETNQVVFAAGAVWVAGFHVCARVKLDVFNRLRATACCP